jgi:hypothetical protein
MEGGGTRGVAAPKSPQKLILTVKMDDSALENKHYLNLDGKED